MATNEKDLGPEEEAAVRGLLREMESERAPTAAVRAQIRRVVEAEWRAAVQQPLAVPITRRWRRPALALAAVFALAAVTLGLLRQLTPPAPAVVASLARVGGPVEVESRTGWQPVQPGDSLVVGQRLVTGSTGKAALALADGLTLRLDVDSRVAVVAIDRWIVERGAVYLDAGTQTQTGPGLRLESAFGSTRHLGTQYELRLLPAAMQVSVREGQVDVRGAATSRSGVKVGPGEQALIARSGTVTRTVIGRRDERWNWIGDVTPPYSIEERPLADFLVWVSRETGRELAFASTAVETEANALLLRGSIAGLSPDAALAAIMATTTLSYSDENGQLLVKTKSRQTKTP